MNQSKHSINFNVDIEEDRDKTFQTDTILVKEQDESLTRQEIAQNALKTFVHRNCHITNESQSSALRSQSSDVVNF